MMHKKMKLTINADELREWEVCSTGLGHFVAVHGENTVSLEKALESNSVKEFIYVFFRNKNHFSDAQVKDIKLLICNFAEHVLAFFEEKYPEDKRPRKAIETARKYICGGASANDVVVAADAATVAAHSVAVHSLGAAFYIVATVDIADVVTIDDACAAHSVVSAADIYAYAAGGKEEHKWQRQKLIELIEKWKIESDNYERDKNYKKLIDIFIFEQNL